MAGTSVAVVCFGAALAPRWNRRCRPHRDHQGPDQRHPGPDRVRRGPGARPDPRLPAGQPAGRHPRPAGHSDQAQIDQLQGRVSGSAAHPAPASPAELHGRDQLQPGYPAGDRGPLVGLEYLQVATGDINEPSTSTAPSSASSPAPRPASSNQQHQSEAAAADAARARRGAGCRRPVSRVASTSSRASSTTTSRWPRWRPSSGRPPRPRPPRPRKRPRPRRRLRQLRRPKQPGRHQPPPPPRWRRDPKACPSTGAWSRWCTPSSRPGTHLGRAGGPSVRGLRWCWWRVAAAARVRVRRQLRREHRQRLLRRLPVQRCHLDGLGYPGRPDLEPPAMQDQAAMRLQAESGWGQWPACSAALGLT